MSSGSAAVGQTDEARVPIPAAGGYWIARSSRAMTALGLGDHNNPAGVIARLAVLSGMWLEFA